MIAVIHQTKAEFDHTPFAHGELSKRLAYLFAEHLVIGGFHWPAVARILDYIAERVFIFIRPQALEGGGEAECCFRNGAETGQGEIVPNGADGPFSVPDGGAC